jgi:POTRA domain, FtsQ-type
MKIVGSKRALRSPKFHERQERIRKIKIALWSLFALAIVITPFIILRNKKLLISDIHLVGNVVTTSDDINQIVNADMAGNYWHLVPRSSSLFYPKSKIEQDILTDLPRVSQVVITLTSPSSITVAIVERNPVALYCQDVSTPADPKDCYFIDGGGYIFAAAPVFSSAVYHIYTSDPNVDSPVKDQFFKPETFTALQNFWSSVESAGLAPLLLTQAGSEYHLTLSSGTNILWRQDQDLDKMYSSLTSFVGDPNIKKQGVNNLTYIDLRVDDKVFYKFQGE